MSRCLVAYGNELRGDDGAAWELARRLSGWTVHCVTQLLPELADQLQAEEEVVFVDACQGGVEVRCQRLTPQDVPGWPVHCGQPAQLLALCRQLYGRAPRAFVLTLPGQDFGYRMGLSALAQESVRQGLQRLGQADQGSPIVN